MVDRDFFGVVKDVRGVGVREAQTTFQWSGTGAIPSTPQLLRLRTVPMRVAKLVYEWWHYLGTTPFMGAVHYGVYFGEQLVGCLSYGQVNAPVLEGVYDYETQTEWLELKRFALMDSLPKNSESRVLSVSLKLLRKDFPSIKGVVTYADIGQNHKGTIYKASNFEYRRITAKKSEYVFKGKVLRSSNRDQLRYRNVSGEWREKSQKHLFIKRF